MGKDERKGKFERRKGKVNFADSPCRDWSTASGDELWS